MAKSEQQESLKSLGSDLRFWGWPGFFAALPSNAVLVIEPKFIKALGLARGKLQCQVMAPEKAWKSPTLDQPDAVVVFAAEREWQLARKLAQANPSANVVGATYHLAAVSLTRPLKLPEGLARHSAKKPDHAILMLSTPGSDGEYVAQLMAANGLPEAREYLAKPFINLLDHIKGFQPLTFLKVAAGLNSSEGVFALHLQTDVLQKVIKSSRLNAPRLNSLIEKSGASLMRIRREGRSHQAAMLSLMHGRPMRSVWTLPPAQKKNFPGSLNIPTLIAFEQISALEEQDLWLSKLLRSQNRVLTIDPVNVAEDQKRSLTDIAKHLGINLGGDDVKTMDYWEPYNKPALAAMTREFQRELIDRIGLHVL